MHAFGAVREVFATQFDDLVDQAFQAENKLRILEKQDPLRSLDAFLGEVGGDAAKKAYYRTKRFLSDAHETPLREGAFTGLVRSVSARRIPNYKLEPLILEFTFLRGALQTSEENRTSWMKHFDDQIDELCRIGAQRRLRSEAGFREFVAERIEGDIQENNYESAINAALCLCCGIVRDHPKLRYIQEPERSRCLSILSHLGECAATEIDCYHSAAAFCHFSFHSNGALNALAWRLLASSQNTMEWIRHPISGWHRATKNSIASAMTAYNSLSIGIKNDWQDSELHAGYSTWAKYFGMSLSNEDLRIAMDRLSERKQPAPLIELGAVEYHEMLGDLGLRKFESAFEQVILHRSNSAQDARRIASFWMAAGHLALSPMPKHHVGGSVWKCLQQSKEIMVKYNLRNYATWCDWYILCARAFEGVNPSGCLLALQRALSLEKKLGKRNSDTESNLRRALLDPKGISVNGLIEKELILFLDKPAWPLRKR